MAKKLQVGFIGAGGISLRHYDQLEATKKATVAALTEPNPKVADWFRNVRSGAAKLPVYTDYKDMIKKEDLDAVVILSPHVYHYDQICTSLKSGLHVLCEKPMVCRIADAKDVIKRAKKSDRVLALAYQRHFEPEFRYMRAQIAKGVLGEIQFVQALQAQQWYRATKGTWRQSMKLSCGGQLNDSGSHLIDIIMWVTGMKVKEVFAMSENFESEVDINSTLSMKFENGALGSMSIIGNAPIWHEDHTIVGSKGAFYLRQGLGLRQLDDKGQPVELKYPKAKGDCATNFIASILGKEEPQAPPQCGLRTIEVTEAAWQSAAAKKPVRVP